MYCQSNIGISIQNNTQMYILLCNPAHNNLKNKNLYLKKYFNLVQNQT